jgi:hypothetical protein
VRFPDCFHCPLPCACFFSRCWRRQAMIRWRNPYLIEDFFFPLL